LLATLFLFVVLGSCSGATGSSSSTASVLAAPAVQSLDDLRKINETAGFTPLMDMENYPTDIQEIHARGVLVVAMTKTDQKPFFFVNEKTGELEGLDVELSYEIANRLGVKVEFNRSAESFNNVVMLVASGEADIAISKLSRTLARAQLVLFTQPYITFRQGLLVNRLQLAQKAKDDEVAAFIKNMTGKLGVIAKSSYVGFAKANFPHAEIVEYPSWTDAEAAVFKGDVLSVYRDEMEILKVIANRKDAALHLKTIVLKDKKDPIAMAVSKNRAHLAEWIDIFLDEYKETHHSDLNAESLVNKYFSATKAQ